jgi:hypothetical protein
LTLTIDDLVSSIADFADSLLGIELLAGFLDLAADSVLVEEVSIGALQAGVSAPHFAPEVVVNFSEQGSVIKLVRGERELLSGGLAH